MPPLFGPGFVWSKLSDETLRALDVSVTFFGRIRNLPSLAVTTNKVLFSSGVSKASK